MYEEFKLDQEDSRSKRAESKVAEDNKLCHYPSALVVIDMKKKEKPD